VDVLRELKMMRARFVNCAINTGSCREFVNGACKSYDKAVAAIAELIAERSSLEEQWFMCCHPAWPDPLRCWGGRDDAIATLKSHPHPDAWLLCELSGGRVEYKGAELAALAGVRGES
jgi:hypothetical protein